jgi:predicted  nucleic acid-binding Zn-ribbon protein
MYEKQIEQLIVLQQLDDEIILLEEELVNAPRELQDLEERHQALTEEMEALKEKRDMLSSQHKRLSSEIEDDNLKIKKSKNKLMMASNTKEYQAMMREMDNLEKLNRMREDENMALVEEIGRLDAEAEELGTRATEVEDELTQKRKSLDKRVNAAKKRLTELQAKRDKACEIIPKPILSRYEFIRSRLENPVIVEVDTGICAGCNIAIPPQTFNELQRGKQIHSCPNCQRLIYWSEHMPQEAEKETAEAEQAGA